jgi:hypothetical protein
MDSSVYADIRSEKQPAEASNPTAMLFNSAYLSICFSREYPASFQGFTGNRVDDLRVSSKF